MKHDSDWSVVLAVRGSRRQVQPSCSCWIWLEPPLGWAWRKWRRAGRKGRWWLHLRFSRGLYHYSVLLLLHQPSPVKKERSVRPQSFCPTSGTSSQDKASPPVAFVPPHRDKQRLSYGAFANPVYSTSSDGTAARLAGRGKHVLR